MTLVEKVVALLTTLQPADMRHLSLSQRRHFAALLKFWAATADPDGEKTAKPSTCGVLSALGNGERSG